MSELVLGSQHTGAHIDAHAHMTIRDRWHGGSAATDLGDFGPLKGDATEIPPLWRRVMDHRLVEHYGGDLGLANVKPSRSGSQRKIPTITPSVASSQNPRCPIISLHAWGLTSLP